ncbi:MAG: amidohydrolase family protein, partial [Alphaproteobacteria bacterium]|nr:amidohydrolase family protein [Alphaproteobacteria bacterium]
ARVRPAGEFAGFAGQRIDTAGKTVMPGLIDCHVHVCLGAESDLLAVLGQLSPAELAIRAFENAQATLRGGATTCRDIGGKDYIEMPIRDAFKAGRQLGPTMLCAGKLICITGGHGWWLGAEVDGVDAIVRAVRQNIKMGADLIKLIATGGVLTPNVDPLKAQLSLAEVTAAVAEALRFDRKTAAHAIGAPGIRNAVDAGVASIEHGFQMTEDIIAKMIARGIYLVPTISALRGIVTHANAGIPQYAVDKALRLADMHRTSVDAYHKAGGRIAMGTDAGTPFNYHGENAQELGFLVEYGLTPLQALQASTRNAADLCTLPDRGRVREGAWADLLVVRGNPAQDISAVADKANHTHVFKEGFDVKRILGRPIPGPAVRRLIHDEPAF